MSVTETDSYLILVEKARKAALEILRESPELDYSTILHTILNLSPTERLAKSRRRANLFRQAQVFNGE
ncbi:hypothetical protein JNK13_00825 [bacterium]|nr:hypothetical protein [bacterium]